MGWFIAYLVSVIVVPTIYMAISTSLAGEQFKAKGEEFLLALMLCLIWPITFSVDVYDKVTKARKESTRLKVEELSRKIYENRHDRTFMVDIPEGELKYLARMYRKKKTELNASQFEMIREELMHRLTEKHLLK